MKTSKVEFQAPSGVVPEGTQSGEEFDIVCTFRVKDSGSVCLTMMGDSKMPGYDDKDSKRPDYKQYSQDMMQQGDAMNSDNQN